jgi:putative hydrolase of the HAD superfamily
MTKAIIFDVDSCLAAADEVGEQLFAPAFAAIRAANDGSIPQESCWPRSPSAGASRSMPSPTNPGAMRAAGWQVFRQTEVTGPIYGYGDLREGFAGAAVSDHVQ